MARRRRKQRRSATRNTASLLALALPAPLQRLANSPVGPLLMFFGLPAMLVAGLLQVDWQNGAPHLVVNPEKASKISQAVQGGLEKLPGHAAMEQLQQSARDTWNAHVPSSSQLNSPSSRDQSLPTAPGHYSVNGTQRHWPAPTAPLSAASTPSGGMVNPYTHAPFPSTKRPGYVSTPSNTQTTARQTWGEQPQRYAPQQTATQPYPSQPYPSQPYPSQPYSSQQYSSQQYSSQQYSSQQSAAEQRYQPSPPSQQYHLPQPYGPERQYQQPMPAQQSW